MYQYIILERKQQFCWVNNLFFKTRIQEGVGGAGSGEEHGALILFLFETLTIDWAVIDDAHQINDK